MNSFEAAILGIIQGLTEFLPVSSSGHLELAKAILGDDSLPKESLAFTIILHFATALSTLVIFKDEILEILKGLFQFQWNEETQFSLKIIISMIPTVCVGLYFEDELSSFFDGQILLVGLMLFVTALLLLLADKAKDTFKEVSFLNAWIVGISQAIAILPGISRSGATICTSLFLGNSKSDSAKFSFLIVIPVIFGAILKDVFSGEIFNNQLDVSVLIIGFLSSFIFGLLACKLMLKIVNNNNLIYFSFYCFILGIISISLL